MKTVTSFLFFGAFWQLSIVV